MIPDAEIHVYWQGQRIDRVTVKLGDGDETEIPRVLTVRRDVRNSERPHVELLVGARLLEHREPV